MFYLIMIIILRVGFSKTIFKYYVIIINGPFYVHTTVFGNALVFSAKTAAFSNHLFLWPAQINLLDNEICR